MSTCLTTKYEPNKEYSLEQVNITETTVDLFASKELLAYMADRGHPDPSFASSLDTTFTVTTTFDYDSLGFLPVEISMIESNKLVTRNGVIVPSPTDFGDIALTGKYDSLNVLIIDSIVGDFSDGEMEALFIKTFEYVEYVDAVLAMEDTCIGMGGKCINTVSADVPIQDGQNFSVDFIYTYKLKKVIEDVSYFDVDIVYNVNLNMASIEVIGDGKGVLEYNNVTKQVQKAEFKTKLDMKLDMGTFKMSSKTEGTTSYKYVVKDL